MEDLTPTNGADAAVVLLEGETMNGAAEQVQRFLPDRSGAVLITDEEPGPRFGAAGRMIAIGASELDCLVPVLLEAADQPSSEIRYRDLELVVHVRRAVVKSRSLSVALRAAFEALNGVVQLEYAEAWIPSHDRASLELVEQWVPEGETSELAPSMRSGLSSVRIDPGIGVPAAAWRTRYPIVLFDLASNEAFVRRSLARDFGLDSVATIAARDGAEAQAVVMLFADRDVLTPQFFRVARTVIGQLGDLLHLKSFEQELGETRAMLEKLFASLNEAVFVVGESDRLIRQCNEAAARMFGYERDELIGKDTERLHTDRAAWERFGAESRRAINVSGVYEGRYLMKRRDGTVFPTEHTVTRMRADEGGVGGVVSVVRDRTEAVRYEQELDSLRTELSHVARVALLGQLAAGVIHSLSNPLTAIESHLGLAEHLCTTKPDFERFRGQLDRTRGEMDRVREIIQQLRDFVKRRRPQRAEVDPAQIVRDSARLLQSTVERRGVVLEFDLRDHPGTVVADRIQIEQVLINLVQNGLEAIESTNGSGRITISLRADERGAVFRVTDTGHGLKVSEEVAFESFVTTKEGGLGLGLAMSRFIIESHGGSIGFAPGPGPGACVEFHVPYEGVP
ncbi:MAG: ATP-binding protein [Planctomycetota bacterium]|nr:ATP-binding protein [Planctomycetota bacterium]